MKDRPELVARRLRVESAAENVTLQMKGLSPSLSASAGYSFGNHSYFDHDQWNAGLTLSVPLTDGGLTKSMVEQARAQLRQAEAELVGLENSVTLEVRTAWEDLRQAKESLSSARRRSAPRRRRSTSRSDATRPAWATTLKYQTPWTATRRLGEHGARALRLQERADKP